jgi:ATP-dependent Clp protease adapter protein ClpS
MSKGLSKFMYSQLGELGELFQKKHEQYSSGADELANFRRGALLNGRGDDAEGMFEELKAYMAKHIAFVYTHDIHGDKITESLKDIAVYSLIGLYMVEISRTKEAMMQAHRDCVAALCRYQRDSMEEQLAALLKAATSEPSGINMED